MVLTRIALFVVLFCAWQNPDVPCVRHFESPQYSQIARMARVQGEVALQAEIAPDGSVLSVTSRSGHAILRRDAEDNLKKWVFTEGGHRRVEILYEFRLEPPAVTYIPQSRVIADLPDHVLVLSQPPKTEE